MSALAVMGLASCTNENDPMGNNGQTAEPGEPTHVTLSLDLNNATSTKAIQDDNATTEETKITHLNVFIYDKNGVLENAQKILMDDLTEEGTDNVYTTKALKATTGTKTVYVGLNMTDAMVAQLKATAAQNLTSTAAKVALNDLTNETNGFVMFSTQGKSATFVAVPEEGGIPEANKVTLTVERLASKIAVGCEDAIDDIKQGAAGKIQNLRFVVDNINTLNYFPYDAGAAKDPNMTKAAYNEDDFVIEDDFAAADNWKTITPGTTEKKQWNYAYSAENVTEDKEMQGVTRVVVQGEFIPATLIEKKTTGGDQVTWEDKDNSQAAAATFIQLEFAEAGGYAFFADGTPDADLKEYMAFKKGVESTDITDDMLTKAKKVYTNGYNYWWITTKEGRGDIVRNNFYRVNITSIWAPGRTDGKFDPDKDDEKVDEETNIEFTVTVAQWHLVEQDTELRP